MTTEIEIRLIGGLAFLFIIYSLWMGQLKVQGLPGGYTSPILALELVKNGADIEAINKAEAGKARAFIRTHILKDYGYILIYTLFFVILSLLVSRMSLSWARPAGWLAATCVVIAAVLDVIENRGMWKAVGGDISDSLANSIRYSSLAKWAFLFIFSLLIGVVLMWGRDLLAIPGFLFLSAALLGLSGVILNLLRPRFYWMFPASIVSWIPAVIFIAVSFTFWPEKLLKKLPTFVP
jgi:hypothetical protein